MRILYITQWFSSIGGGGEVLFFQLAKGMATQGHYVNIISHRISNPEDCNIENLKIHRINPVVAGFPPSLRDNITFIFNALWKGLKIIRKEKIDIIHVNNFSPVIVGSILSKICKIRFIKTIHAVYGATPDFWKKWSIQNNVSRLSYIIGPIMDKLTIRMYADIIHTVSNSTKKDLIRFNAKSKIEVIPNVVNLSIYDSSKFTNSYENYILFIGRLVFNKNLGTVISCFELVIKKIPNAKLIIVGSGPMMEKWKKIASDLGLDRNIVFTGYISHDKKMDILSKCTSLVLPSIAEGLPTVVLEAMAVSKPVILSDIEAHSEIIEEGVEGFLISSDNLEKWADKIIFLLSNKSICEKMGAKGRVKVEKQFNMNIMLSKMNSLYLQLQKK